MTAEAAHEPASATSPAANDNAGSYRNGVALVGAPQWRHADAILELAAALGEIAADVWLAGKGPLTATVGGVVPSTIGDVASIDSTSSMTESA